ncbi:TolC family protein [Cytophagaceae bacterium DM2B3-1]|uniref:TolC family protein n=1 Tax=Xanthocytophaga flava TaxID=3048013 RepID=A0ABT7CNP4_9BACT|nr:TolC family protein [Xanthocytophaga flavus]MDJ1473015.1 TolC family protein [Xanthocytophaga flavus]MDJ1495361.1 TolC family protein [Xanthocytophaga flavus]
MQFSRWFLFFILGLSGGLAYSQELTLNQLIDKALQSNQTIQISQISEQQTAAQIKSVKAGARPQVNVSGDYKRYIKIPGQVVPASAFGGPDGTYTTLAFGLPYNLSTSLQVSQAIFNPSIGIGLKAANLSLDLSKLQTTKTKEDVAYNVSVTYYNLQSVTQQIVFLRSNLASTEKLIKVTDLLYKNQLSQGIDVDRLRITHTQTKTQLQSLQASEEQLINMLKFLTGTPQTDSLKVQVAIDEQAIQQALLQQETVNRTDLLLLDRQKALNELNQRNTKAGFIPTLSAYGVANSTFYGQGGEDGVFKHVPGYWVGLQLNWNIYDGSARRAKISSQRAENNTLNLQMQQARESISMEMRNAQNKFLVEQQNLASSREQVTLADKVYTQSQLQFKEGTSSLTDVIQAENSLREAQNNYLNALVNLRSAELDWKKASGNLIAK